MSANEIVASLPFNQHVGLVPRPDGALLLPDDARLLNHVGTRHASALFALGEATSGVVLFDAFSDRLVGIYPVVRSARIEFLKPGRGVLVGRGTVDGDAAFARLEADGKTDLDVLVEVVDEAGVVVAKLVVTWALRRPRT
jgi:acyl-coenzyme A thioesterase PaaI-like protein